MNKLYQLSLFLCCAACTGYPSQKDDNTLKTYFNATKEAGMLAGGVRRIPVTTPNGEYTVWTKRFGNNPTTKVLLLHGGPACTHEYFESFESYLPAEGIEFIYYDQLGSAYSDQPTDTSLWVLPRFVDEVEQVRKALGLNKDNFFLLGHSWGGILAMQYALQYQDNLKGLIISNMMASCPAYDRYAETVLAQQLPTAVLQELMQLEEKKDFSNPKYMELLEPHFYEKHILRAPASEWPDPVKRNFAKLNQSIYVQMQGPSEFGIAGNLANWDVSGLLGNIRVPTLVIGATHDTMDPKYMEWMAGQIPNGQFLLCPNGSHMCMWDDQAHYFPGLIGFLREHSSDN